ncbi:unnamed protein product [Hydatigera taeniaeformis]|uniref:Secreted protein n=1 Tax=Hydatigena taeniaeformis TaxID=6205 RepID=A0A0R3WS96_HYDTA|nr:unnamed protein product [Hydatigera taeniaeformis]
MCEVVLSEHRWMEIWHFAAAAATAITVCESGGRQLDCGGVNDDGDADIVGLSKTVNEMWTGVTASGFLLDKQRCVRGREGGSASLLLRCKEEFAALAKLVLRRSPFGKGRGPMTARLICSQECIQIVECVCTRPDIVDGVC